MGLVAFVGYVSRLQLAFPAQFACYLTAVARSPYVAQGRTPCDDNYRVAKNDKSDSNRIWFVHPLAVTAFEEMEIPIESFRTGLFMGTCGQNTNCNAISLQWRQASGKRGGLSGLMEPFVHLPVARFWALFDSHPFISTFTGAWTFIRQTLLHRTIHANTITTNKDSGNNKWSSWVSGVTCALHIGYKL